MNCLMGKIVALRRELSRRSEGLIVDSFECSREGIGRVLAIEMKELMSLAIEDFVAQSKAEIMCVGGRRNRMGDCLYVSFSFLMKIVRVSRFDLGGNCQWPSCSRREVMRGGNWSWKSPSRSAFV